MRWLILICGALMIGAGEMRAAETNGSNPAEPAVNFKLPSASKSKTEAAPEPTPVPQGDEGEAAPHLPFSIPPSSNLVAEAGGTGGALRTFQLKMDEAHRHRVNKDYDAAEKCLKIVYDGDAPEDMKKAALLELAAIAEETHKLVQAQQIYSKWVHKYSEDPGLPEVLLRQGLTYRDMGAYSLAMAKFYSVMSTALAVKLDRLDYYKKLVLRAQIEVAETYYVQGRYADAADYFGRLLRLDTLDLNKRIINYKLLRCLSLLGRDDEVTAKGEIFLGNYPDCVEEPEVRFMMAKSFKKMGRTSESLLQVSKLLETQEKSAGNDPGNWKYWQQRTGNEVANQLYEEGDYLNALLIYSKLADLDLSPSWQLPVLYQIGLVYEALKQPEKASELYRRVTDYQKNLDSTKTNLNLNTVIEMAKWRQTRLDWQAKAEKLDKDLRAAAPGPDNTVQ